MNNPNTTKEKILEELREEYLGNEICDLISSHNYSELKLFVEEKIDQVISETRQEVLKQVEEIIPEESIGANMYQWNDCRAEFINNLSKLK